MNRYMNRKNIDFELKSRIRTYLDFLFNQKEEEYAEEEEQLISQLSTNLREELLLNTKGKMLKENLFFSKNFSDHTISKLVFIMKPRKFSPDEIICDVRNHILIDFDYFFKIFFIAINKKQ